MGNCNSHSKHKKHKLPSSIMTDTTEYVPDQDKELAHYLSNNDNAVDRINMYHFFKRCLFQGNFSSPVEDKLIEGNFKVLDIGCGPGTWLLDLSSIYKNSKFFGIDIKPVFPQEIKPRNLEFVVGDVIDGLPFYDEEFDLVHVDSMGLIFTTEQWNFILTEVIRVTKPGGYIEVADKLNEFKYKGPIYHKLTDGLFNSYSKRNVDLEFVSKIESIIKSQPNIENVHRFEKSAILGPNGGKIGSFFQELSLLYYNSEMAIDILSNELGISKDEYKDMIKNDLIEELNQTSPEHTHVRIWAQKTINRFPI